MKTFVMGAAATLLAAPLALAQSGDIYIEGAAGYAFEGDYGYNGLDFTVEGDWSGGVALGITDLIGDFDVELDIYSTSRGYEGYSTSLDSLSVMVNGLYDFDMGDSPITPYVGLGIGQVKVEYDGANQFPAFSDEEWVFGWQAMAGGRWQANEQFSLFAEWRYQSAEDADLAGLPVEYGSHNLLLGGRLTFGQ